MTKEQKKHGIMGLIMILVLVGVFYYTKTNQQSSAPNEEVANDLIDTKEPESVNKKTENLGSATINTAKTEDTSKFNTLIESGSAAFHAKDYKKAIDLFNKALAIKDADFIYARLHSVYAAMGDKVQAVKMIDQAVAKNQLFTEYWVTKLVYLEEKTDTSFAELKQIYNDGLGKVDSRTKTNLVTTFARIAESNGMKDEAIAAWQKAIELYPTNKATYQAEIDRLKSL